LQKFVDVKAMPRKIAVSIANDDISLARKVLMENLKMSDEDLVTITKTQTMDHAQAIAMRKSVSAAVVDALVTTGDRKVMQLVAENLGASLSQKAVDVLVDAARYTDALRKPILNRPELMASQATNLYWWVSQDLRRIVLKRFGISAGQINESLNKTIEEFLGYHQLERNDDQTMQLVADWLAERDAVAPHMLPQILRLSHYRLFNIMLSRLTNVSVSLIDTIIDEAGGRGMAVICRSLGIDKAEFVSIFLLSRGARNGDQVVHPRELSDALGAFERLSPSNARDIMTSWQADPSLFVVGEPEDIALGA
jgi:uncharacterized protein (DUF2336 family)